MLGNLTLVRALEFLVPTMLLMLGNQVMYQKFFSAQIGEGRADFSDWAGFWGRWCWRR